MELKTLFDLFPVGLAIVSTITCSYAVSNNRRATEKFVLYCGAFCSCLLIIAQLSLWSSNVLQGNVVGTFFADVIWVIFNSMVMVAFIALSIKVK